MADPKKVARKSKSNKVKSHSLTDDFNSPHTPVGAELAKDRELLKKYENAKMPRPNQTRIITVANQKGGVGKTTTTVNIAAALALGGLNVIVVDADPQGNASTALGVQHAVGTPSTFEVVMGEMRFVDVLQKSPDFESLVMAPSTIDLSSAEISLIGKDRREYRLHDEIRFGIEQLGNSGQRVDYVIIDCPPSLGLLTLNALVAADEVFIPIQTEYYALEGLTQLMKTIEAVRENFNPKVHISTILLTMFDKRTNLSQEVSNEVREYFPEETLATEIPRNIKISEAPSFQKTVMTYDPRSTGAIAYLAAAHEIAERA